MEWDALENKRIEDVVQYDSPLAKTLETLRSFRAFIDKTREKLGEKYRLFKTKETQLIQLHRKIVSEMKAAKKIGQIALIFFQERRKDYEAMINLILKNSSIGNAN